MEKLKYRPVGPRVLVEVVMSEQMRKILSSGLALPESVIEKERKVSNQGRVLALGKVAYQDYFDGEPWCKVGDLVQLKPASGVDIAQPDLGVIYRFINDDDVIAIIEESGNERI